jgi:hypothetical protein
VITVEIGSSSRQVNDPRDVDESWVNQQIHRRKADAQRVCVRVTIHCDSVNVILASADCGGVGGAGRPPNTQEERIFDLWNRCGMRQPDVEPHNLIAFLNALRQLVKA